MITRTWLTGVALVMVVVCGASLHAQTLQVGTWTGKMVFPNVSLDVSYEVKTGADGLNVTLFLPTRDAPRVIPLTKIGLEGATLSFAFSGDAPGEVRCILKRQDAGGYAGECKAPNGSVTQTTMTPPES